MGKIVAIVVVVIVVFIGAATFDSCKRHQRCGFGNSQP